MLNEQLAAAVLQVVADYMRLPLYRAQVAQVVGERPGRNLLE